MNQVHQKTWIAVLFCVSLFPLQLLAEEPDGEKTWPLSGYSVSAGPTFKLMEFDYYRSSEDSEPAGTMTEGFNVSYFVKLGSPYHFFSNSRRYGYFFEAEYSGFSLDKQEIGAEERDMGTSVEGSFWYVTPVAFMLFGPVPQGEKEWSVFLGVGAGLGYLDVSGDIYLTEDGSYDYRTVDESGVDIAASVIIEAHYDHWVTRISGGGPFLEVGDNTYSMFSFSWDLGYSFYF